jgi:tripartite-type tricarboxylate transporter receptor subunit TctC
MALCAATLLSEAARAAATPTYPSKPLRVVSTVTAGGPAELVARIVGQKLTEQWGQQVVIDTRAGAAGTIGAEIVARAVPDGYTLLLGSGANMVIAPLVVKTPYDPIRDFAQVSMVAISPFALVVHPSVGAKSVADLIAAAKARPGVFNFGSTGVGSTSHLGGEQLKMLTGIDIRHVAYKGAVPAVADLVGGQIQILFNSMASALPQVKAGRLILLATCGLTRSPLTPDTPILAETWPGFEVVTWYSIVSPAKMPRALVMKLNQGLHKALEHPDTIARFHASGNTPAPSTPEAMVEYTRSEMTKFSKIIKAAGVRIDG